jgi:PAS domain S-box-containing protein
VAKPVSWIPGLASALPALAVMALGATVLAGHLAGRPELLLAGPGLPAMGPASAIGMILAGLTLLAALAGGRGWWRVRVAGGLALILLGLVELADLVFDRPLARLMSPLTASAFVLAGLLAMTFDVPGDRVHALLVQVLAGALPALGMVSIIGYDIDPAALLPGYRGGWMPVATAAGFIAIGVALLALIGRSRWYAEVYLHREDEKILILTMGILLLMSLAMSTAGFSMIQRNLELSVRSSLEQAAVDRASILENILGNRLKQAAIISARPLLVERLARVEPTPARRAELAAEAASFIDSGFTGLAIEGAGKESGTLAEAGTLLGPAPLEAPLQGLEAPAALVWNQRFYLRSRVPVWRDFTVVGHVIAEQPLEVVDRLQVDVGALGRTAEWVLCAPEPARMACFPQRFNPLPRYAPRHGEAADMVPVEMALAGSRGVASAVGEGGSRLIAGYAPVGTTGLGVMLKLDAEEYYAPVRRQLGQWWRWLIALALLGTLLVSSQVRPVAQRLMRSERVARERATDLERSERSLRELYAALADGIVVMAPDGTIEFMNPAAERLFGAGEGELLGKPVALLIPEKLREANARATQAFMKTGASDVIGRKNLLFPAMRRDGTSMEIEFSLAELVQEGRTRIVAVVRDVSERENLVRMKGEFIAKVSHELRTPLTAVIGSLELLREDEDIDMPPHARGFLDMAWRNTERLATLVNDVIDTERIESGALVFRDMEFEIAPLVRESVELNQPYAAREKVTLAADPDMPRAFVRADRDRIMQVMANLLSNAAKFSPEGGTVRVTVTRSGDTVRISVADRGPGIPDEFRSRIFGKFAQADGSDTREVGGTGLGLAIAKTIVERVGGVIGFDSERGVGTTFWFELPASNPR